MYVNGNFFRGCNGKSATILANYFIAHLNKNTVTVGGTDSIGYHLYLT